MSYLICETYHRPEKVNFNFFCHELIGFKKSLLFKGLIFTISLKLLDYTGHTFQGSFVRNKEK